MIVDSLTHITPNGRWFSTAYDASTRTLLQQMDNAGLERAVVVALADYIENEFVLSECIKHSDRLIPGASINPIKYKNLNDASVQIKAIFEKGDYKILKLHPRLHKYDLSDFRFLHILNEVVENKIKVNIWLDTLLRYPGAIIRTSPIDAIRRVLEQFPSINFVLLHACGPEILNLAESIRGYNNVLIDVSYTMHRFIGSSVALDLSFLFDKLDKKIIFGSDFPEVSIMQALDDFTLLSKSISLEKQNIILCNNLLTLLNV